MTGEPAHALARALAAHGTTMAFGLPGGGPNLDVVGALTDHGINFVLAHSETAACIMASTWGWLTDHVTVAIVTRGPGAASAVNGAAQATFDRQPLLLITDTVPKTSRERVAHQRIDQVAMLAPACKASAVLGHESTIADVTAAIDVAQQWPPGAVHLDYDTSAAGSMIEAARPAADNDSETGRAIELIAGARRPIVIVGLGAARCVDRLRPALESFGAPVFTTYQAVGAISTEHDLCAGLFTNGASERGLVDQADVIIAVGLDMVEPIPEPWGYQASVVSIAPTPTTDTYMPIAVELVGDPAALATAVLTGAHDWDATVGFDHRSAVRHRLANGSNSSFGPLELVKTLIVHGPAGATVTVDSGAHFLAIMPFWPVARPAQLLISNGLATMGYAVPAAIGAALARPGEPLIALVGDGGLGMTLAELETIARLGLGITVVVFNDNTLSLIKIKQQANHGGHPAVGYGPTNFAAIASAMGIAATVATSTDEVAAALRGHDHRLPQLIDARIDPASYRHLLAVTRG